MMRHELKAPRGARLYCVRWVQQGGRATRHKYFLEREPARRYAWKLRGYGLRVRTYVTDVRWTEVER